MAVAVALIAGGVLALLGALAAYLDAFRTPTDNFDRQTGAAVIVLGYASAMLVAGAIIGVLST